ncbi:type IV pilus modification protein PilV [Thiomonas sp.]|jgi:type IV pilus assembly protein PilV|uniref:type IV pilus modification protein PilV n=1 Tax=Thiomonas sp. TaxID=2047785 RepID=UPI00260D10BD|nr:type IV pilus modification protein PilV [Thiomonas sp.]
MRRDTRGQRGFTLIEVLVAMLVLAFGILGMISLQALAVGQSTAAEDRARATQLANNLAAQMWLDKGAKVTAAQISTWQGTLDSASNPATGLPGGSGSVSYDSTHKLSIITVTWTDPHTGTAHQYQTVVQIPDGTS